MKDYCTQNNGNCETCSLLSYNRDCENTVIKRGRPTTGIDKVQMGVKIPREIKDEFMRICNSKGYSPSIKLEQLIASWNEKENPSE